MEHRHYKRDTDFDPGKGGMGHSEQMHLLEKQLRADTLGKAGMSQLSSLGSFGGHVAVWGVAFSISGGSP